MPDYCERLAAAGGESSSCWLKSRAKPRQNHTNRWRGEGEDLQLHFTRPRTSHPPWEKHLISARAEYSCLVHKPQHPCCNPEKPVSQRIASVAGGLAPNGDGPKKPRGEYSRSACPDLSADRSPESPASCSRADSEVAPGIELAGGCTDESEGSRGSTEKSETCCDGVAFNDCWLPAVL